MSECMMAAGGLRSSSNRRLRQRSPDSRRHQRVMVSLQGRYMLEDRHEFECLTINMSPGGIALAAPVAPAIGGRVVVYLDGIGRIDGNCVRDFGNGFAMSLKATPHRREKIAEQLTWIANQQLLGLENMRSSGRIVPVRLQTVLSFENGTKMPARIVDLSRSGVALVTDCVPAIGSTVAVGQMKGHVVRILDHGIAVQFVRLVPLEMFAEQIDL